MRNFMLFLIYLLSGFSAFAQISPPYWDEVQTIKRYDKIYQVAEHPILFVGSSSIRKWDGLQIAFGSYNVINRGIGGAVFADITFYLKDIVFPYNRGRL